MDKHIGIGYMKSFLTVSMIFAHLIQIIAPDRNQLFSFISIYVNLTTFSAFFFCFGYVYQLAYFSREDDLVSRKKIFTGLYKTLCSFYISALFFRIIKSGEWKFDLNNIISIILLKDIPVYSEFLIAFSLVSVIILVFYKYVKAVMGNGWIVMLSLALFLPYYLVPKDISIYSGLFIGSYSHALFPVVCYFPFFLFGGFISINREYLNYKVLITSMLCTFLFLYYTYRFHQIPSRFPPSPIWLAGAAFPIYVYYLLFDWLGKKDISSKFSKWFFSIGDNSLFYLLTSNLIIFIFSTKFSNYYQPSISKILFLFVLIIFIINYLTRIVRTQQS